mmetsp:Transcript_95656/g.297811  ORF Transcript_95656/g.297811 Transcript_95656/m.297811 type:complete len:267 (+) Transcript_95656:35-835(+)
MAHKLSNVHCPTHVPRQLMGWVDEPWAGAWSRQPPRPRPRRPTTWATPEPALPGPLLAAARAPPQHPPLRASAQRRGLRREPAPPPAAPARQWRRRPAAGTTARPPGRAPATGPWKWLPLLLAVWRRGGSRALPLRRAAATSRGRPRATKERQRLTLSAIAGLPCAPGTSAPGPHRCPKPPRCHQNPHLRSRLCRLPLVVASRRWPLVAAFPGPSLHQWASPDESVPASPWCPAAGWRSVMGRTCSSSHSGRWNSPANSACDLCTG